MLGVDGLRFLEHRVVEADKERVNALRGKRSLRAALLGLGLYQMDYVVWKGTGFFIL